MGGGTRLEGTKLSEKDFAGLPGVVHYKGRARYLYAAGEAQSVFLHGLREGKIIGAVCRRCGRVYVPPRAYCEYCHRPTDGYVEVPDTGEINTAVVSYISTDRKKLEEPVIVGVVRLDAPGYRRDGYEFAGLFHRFCNVKPEDVVSGKVIGMRVRARWRPEEERRGSVLDIECFEPIVEEVSGE